MIPYDNLKLLRLHKPENNTDQLFGIMHGPGESNDNGDWPTGIKHYVFWCSMTGSPNFKRVPYCNTHEIVRKKIKSGYKWISVGDVVAIRSDFHSVMKEQFVIYSLIC